MAVGGEQTQECPSFFIPLAVLASGGSAKLTGLTRQQVALLTMFLTHYGWRSFAFPLLLRGGKPTPVHVWTSAVFFCLCNGFIQVRSPCWLRR
jgi:3-oxo-5-alpha-steroid 4-dehydrogenase 1